MSSIPKYFVRHIPIAGLLHRRMPRLFYMATRFLPNHKQRSIFAIYALCRYIDDLVDETNDLIQQKKKSTHADLKSY